MGWGKKHFGVAHRVQKKSCFLTVESEKNWKEGTKPTNIHEKQTKSYMALSSGVTDTYMWMNTWTSSIADSNS